MAMAMGVASLAVTAPKHTLATPRASANKGEKQGFLDWFRTAMDKESLSELDAVLAKGNDDGKNKKVIEEGKSNVKGGIIKSGVGKNAPKQDAALPPKRGGFSFFGKK